jgi:RNA polymerase sigma-70 factor (ECF subfamily)
MSPDETFAALMAELRRGDDQAAAAVFRRFVHRLVGLARGQLEARVGAGVDPEDVVQSVYRTFFGRYRAGQFEVADWESLWGLLSVITLRKCANRVEYFRAARRDLRREVSAQPAADSLAARQALAPDPTPSEAAILSETVEQLMRDLGERDRAILALHLQGHEIPQISDQVGRTRRTVRRVLEQIRRRLDRLLADDTARA